MNIKILVHIMPWEIDFIEFSFEQIARAKRYLSSNDTVYVDSVLNLSSYIIDWNKSSISKEFFKDKYEKCLKHINEYNVNKKIFDENKLYGHLDFQRETLQSNIDYYITICPDTYFSYHSLFYLIESAKNIKDKYFILTTENIKLWDHTWDCVVNKNFQSIPYDQWNKQNINDIIYFIDNNSENPYLEKLNQFKYAGWFDLYNKKFYEKFIPVMDEWNGYGPWDFFGMNIASFAKTKYNTNIEQYILRNQIICERSIGIFEKKLNPNVYKKYLKLNDIPNQRKNFESKFQEYFIKWHEYAIKNKIL